MINAKTNGYKTLNKKYKLNNIINKKMNKERFFKFTIDFSILFILNYFYFDNTNSSCAYLIFKPFSFNIVKKVLAVPQFICFYMVSFGHTCSVDLNFFNYAFK